MQRNSFQPIIGITFVLSYTLKIKLKILKQNEKQKIVNFIYQIQHDLKAQLFSSRHIYIQHFIHLMPFVYQFFRIHRELCTDEHTTYNSDVCCVV